jgi:hypothetical protein
MFALAPPRTGRDGRRAAPLGALKLFFTFYLTWGAECSILYSLSLSQHGKNNQQPNNNQTTTKQQPNNNMTQTTVIRIMGREKGRGRWKGLDYASGVLVTNKIYNTYWPVEHKAHVENLVKNLNKDNAGYEFKLAKW